MRGTVLNPRETLQKTSDSLDNLRFGNWGSRIYPGTSSLHLILGSIPERWMSVLMASTLTIARTVTMATIVFARTLRRSHPSTPVLIIILLAWYMIVRQRSNIVHPEEKAIAFDCISIIKVSIIQSSRTGTCCLWLRLYPPGRSINSNRRKLAF